MARLNWSEASLTWLEEIHRYISVDNPAAAISVIDGIVQRTKQLQQFPGMGLMLRGLPEGEVRMLLYGHYRIVYLHRPDVNVIEVLGVFHGALEIDRYLP